MTEDFQSDRPDSTHLPPSEFQFSRSDREPIRLMLVGSRAGVIAMIHTLHLKAVAKADEWSEWSNLQPEPMTGKWMSIVTKYIRLE
ncbi:MAG: hypothetical protein HC772_15685 [Leptolyngbyaceae cyanobacterium CRU_2_3]|nr:hypothetical protein [Leptolyngbyaceae cyanobacterium CRU_2_3]